MVDKKREGVWIPIKIWEDNNLTIMEKHILTEIISLDKHNKCFASNNYFAKFFHPKITPQRISQIINSLIKKKAVSARYEREGKQVTKRVLNIFNRYKENSHRVLNKCEEGIKKIRIGYKENAKDNSSVITSINSSNIERAKSSFSFLKIWNKYLRKIGEKAAEKSFTTSVKTEQDWLDINKALANYNKSVQDSPTQYIQYGSTWFANWRDWVDYKESGKKQKFTKYQSHEHFIDKDYDFEKAKAEAKAEGFNVFDDKEYKKKLKEEKNE